MHWLPVVTLLVVTPTQPPPKALVERIVDGIRDITGGGIGHNVFISRNISKFFKLINVFHKELKYL